MKNSQRVFCLGFAIAVLLLHPAWSSAADQPQDSFYYYGPNKLWKTWNDSERRGRDLWIFWSGGNQKFYRRLQQIAGHSPARLSVDFYRLLELSPQDRWEKLGLINEPNFKPAKNADQYGLRLDRWQGDPLGYSPNDYYSNDYDLERYWGEPTGVIGLRKFKNPLFDAKNWSRDKYDRNPGLVEPPYLVGITCAFCHMGFDPVNPPDDPAHPRWENLSASIGNQYFREGSLFFGAGKIVGGNAHKGQGLQPDSFLWHYGDTQQPGTSETSRFTYDFLNNPNTINSFAWFGNRRTFRETDMAGHGQTVLHILKDGADSVSPKVALMRVFLNTGSESEYLLQHLWNPLTGRVAQPINIDELRHNLDAPALKSLIEHYPEPYYKDSVGTDWQNTEARIDDLLAYLKSYGPSRLKDHPLGKSLLSKNTGLIQRGKQVFATECARCHSSKQPPANWCAADQQTWFRQQVAQPEFWDGNVLTDDRRYSVTELGTNMARALGTNALSGDVWANFSSREYKFLPQIAPQVFEYPTSSGKSLRVEFQAPGGGRGYYRTPSLLSMWATAPYLHNNSVGDYDNDPSITGRMEQFESGVRELLWPELRVKNPKIKRVSQAAGLQIGEAPLIETILHRILIDLGTGEVRDVLLHEGWPPAAVEVFTTRLREAMEQVAQDWTDPELRTGLQKRLQKLVHELVHKQFSNPAEATKIELAILYVIQKWQAQLDLKIPAGTPVNLLMNQNMSKFPWLSAALLQHRRDPETLFQRLLELSDCPDLIENRGHYYGSELSDADKNALIVLLRTF